MEHSSGSSDYGVDRNQQVFFKRPSESEPSVGIDTDLEYLYSHSRPYEFCKTVKDLPPDKVAAVNEIGWGHLLDLRINFLYGPIWNLMFRAIDIKNRTVEICGLYYGLTNGELTRVMGITDGWQEVEEGRSLFDWEETFVRRYLFDEGGRHIRIARLVEIVRYREGADNLFKTAFALYALTTLLCPGRDGLVNIGLVGAVLSAPDIKNKKWASYAVNFLLEGAASHTDDEGGFVSGGVMFLQLLYLDVVGEQLNLFQRIDLPPIYVWNQENMTSLVGHITHHGGFSCPLVINKIRERQDRLNDFVNRDKTVGIGIDRSVHEDLYEALVRIDALETRIADMTDMCRGYRPDLAEMKKMMLELGDVIESMKEDIVHRVVDKRRSSIKRKREGKDGATGFGSRSSAKSMSRPSSGCGNIHNIVTSAVDGLKPPCARRLDLDSDKGMATPTKECQAVSACSSSPVGRPTNKLNERRGQGAVSKSVVPRGAARCLYNKMVNKETKHDDIVTVGLHSFRLLDQHIGGMESVHFNGGPYTLQFQMADADIRLINYICAQGTDGRTMVANIGGGRSVLHRSCIKSLLPDTDVTSDVINYYCDFLSSSSSTCWYLPTYFSDNANRGFGQNEDATGRAIHTRSICNMYRFSGRMEDCETIFIPLHYGDKTGTKKERGHWWLLIVHPKLLVAEIWDSAPRTLTRVDSSRIAYKTLIHLDEVLELAGYRDNDFVRDLKLCQVVTPPNVPIQLGGHECGIHTIKNMQCYGTTWSRNYNSHHIRSAMLLECLKDPGNDLYDQVRQRADALHEGADPTEVDIDPPPPIEFSNEPGDCIEIQNPQPTNTVEEQLILPLSQQVMVSTNDHDDYLWTDWHELI